MLSLHDGAQTESDVMTRGLAARGDVYDIARRIDHTTGNGEVRVCGRERGWERVWGGNVSGEEVKREIEIQ